jgi:pyruvate formate lyase activating enzyme
VPLHFTAFHPDFKLRDKPRTPPETLHAARAIAIEAGLHYVYEGNIYSEAANTSCPRCKSLLIQRSWHDVTRNLLKNGCCPNCNLEIPGRWNRANEPASKQESAESKALVAERYSHLNL